MNPAYLFEFLSDILIFAATTDVGKSIKPARDLNLR